MYVCVHVLFYFTKLDTFRGRKRRRAGEKKRERGIGQVVSAKKSVQVLQSCQVAPKRVCTVSSSTDTSPCFSALFNGAGGSEREG